MTDHVFDNQSYNEESLKNMSTEDLLVLRNKIATSLGVAELKSFKDHDTAVSHTLKALVRADETAEDQKTEAKAGKAKPKAKKEPKERGLAKSAEAKFVKRPTQKMFATITKNPVPDDTVIDRAHRWPNYKDGMTIVDVIETEGTEPWDVYNWASKGLVTVTEATDEQFAERKAAWYKKHNLTDPEAAKAAKAAERAKAKAEREAAAEAKKKAREAAAAEKKAAAEAKKKAAEEKKAAAEKAAGAPTT